MQFTSIIAAVLSMAVLAIGAPIAAADAEPQQGPHGGCVSGTAAGGVQPMDC
ncbi:hypothetical protein EJ04DRAFT_560800 [Polyplosphaeria fusca]|uniref:Uncharacterized protein n=1 Tax=Polyplosphaeria fusca TaxID=682080 RepID=A0A9P4V6E1_9PLEO|nr:hypothetical protein EJ04DRAFT_560800 [Polyplosphaeria fusca]